MKGSGIRRILSILLILSIIAATGCGNRPVAATDVLSVEEPDAGNTIIGFSQLGAESDYRSANSESIKNVFIRSMGYTLMFEDGQQKQSNQIRAIRKFIQSDADYILLSPVTETGWDTVLMEAKDAGIPVILVDRTVEVESDDLYLCHVGSDFYLEAQKACEWLKAYIDAIGMKDEDVHIVDLQGTLGSSAQIGRTLGLKMAAAKYGWDLKAAVTADFTQAKGREVMKQLYTKYKDINVVYCENDNEALGAIEAIEAAGRHPGSDINNRNVLKRSIMVMSFDGVSQAAIDMVKEDKISCIVECNPDLGPDVKNIIKDYESGVIPPKDIYVDEKIYSSNGRVESVSVNGVDYEVTVLKK